MQKFIDYVTAFDPAFPSRIRGATQEEIACLERLAGPPLPSFYREYLEFMGHADDGLIGKQEPSTDISDVIDLYEQNVASGEEPVPDDAIFIGVAGSTMENIAIERNGTGRVFEISDGKKYTFWADSLEKLIYQEAYTRYRPRQFPHSAFYANSNKLQAVTAASAEAIRLGFEPQWFSDAVTFCAEKYDAVLIISQLERQGLWLRVAATNPTTPDEIARRLAEITGVAIKRSG